MKTMGDQGAVGDAVRTAGSFSNQMKRLRGRLHDTSVVIGQALLPGATALVVKVAEVVRFVSEWAQRNQSLIATLFKVLLGVTAGGVALVALGVIISSLGTVLGAIAATFTAVGAVIAALVSPIALVITSIAGLGA